MKHMDEGALMAARDGVVPPEHESHLAQCAQCRKAMRALERRRSEIGEALSLLDEPMDMEGAREAVRRRVTEAAARATGATPIPERKRRSWWTMSRVAGLLLVTAAGASALPGSPIRGWLGDRFAGPDAAAVTSEPDPVAEAGRSGIRLDVAGPAYTVALQGLAAGDRIRVRFGPGTEVSVQAAPGSRFTSLSDRLEAELAPGPVEIELPRGTARVSLEVGGRIYLRTSPAGVETLGPVEGRGPDGTVFRVADR